MKKIVLILATIFLTTAATTLPSDPNGLRAELTFANPQVQSIGDLNVSIKLTNISNDDLVQFHNLDNLQVYIKIRQKGGQQLINQSEKQTDEQVITGVIRISPGQSSVYNYHGLQSPALPPGNYEAQFDFHNFDGAQGDWVGEVKSKWIDFTILPQ